jgi:hypothetical protein
MSAQDPLTQIRVPLQSASLPHRCEFDTAAHARSNTANTQEQARIAIA